MWRHWPYSTVLLAALLFALVGAAGAQTPSEAPAAEKAFPADQIQQIVAPIALYPDALIAQILMAATYPLDVVQANRWLGDQEGVEGEALQSAVDSETWDDSVKALVFFPSVLQFMSDNLDWTQDLGDAVLAQQGDVTETIQRLRGEADEAGALASNEQQRVEKAGDTIIIQPAQPEVVYVPTYDPVKVYGESAPPATQYYPDAYADASASYDAGYAAGVSAGGSTTALVPSGQVVPADGAYTTSAVDTSNSGLINFGVGALAGGLLTAAIMWDDDDDWNDRIYYGGGGRYGGPSYWGGSNYWNNNGWREPANINVDRTRNIDIDRNVERGDININKGLVGNEINRNDVKKWEHNPERRGGVRYRDSSTEKRFSAKRKETTIGRDEARGRVRQGDHKVKAPDIAQVKREGAASGGIANLAEKRGDGGGNLAGLKEGRPAGGGDARAKVQDRAPQARDKVQAKAPQAREKVQAKAPAAKQKVQAKAPAAKAKAKAAPKPKARPAAAKQRPVNKSAARPAVNKAKAAPRPAAKPAKRAPSRSQGSAFKASKPKASRAASHRGSASRAKSSHRGGGGGGRGGRG